MEAQIIRMALSTLNNVEVKGKDNLSRMLGAMEALESVAQALEQPREEAKEEPRPPYEREDITLGENTDEEVTTDG